MVMLEYANRLSGERETSDDGRREALRIGYVEGALPGTATLAMLQNLFPDAQFVRVDAESAANSKVDILLVKVDAVHRLDVNAALSSLSTRASGTAVVICLDHADIETTHDLIHAGAADVLPEPVSEPSLVLCLERLIAQKDKPFQDSPEAKSELVAVLKAGGGVGATALMVQLAGLVAGHPKAKVCIADLDLQFGNAATYLDMPDAMTISDTLTWGAGLADAPYDTALTSHSSGIRLLAAPREMIGLDTFSGQQIEALTSGLKKSFSTVFVDLPPAWTHWTYQVLQKADRIILVTNLSVGHVQLTKKQLVMLATQRLDVKPLILVCNAVSSDHLASVPQKTAERSIGRPFDVVIPYDSRTMLAALNQGVTVSSIRHGGPIDKALTNLSAKFVASPEAASDRRSR